MVPLDIEATEHVLGWDVGSFRAVSLRHALIHRRPGLWGDHPRRPRSVVFLREAETSEGWHAFGAGEAAPAVGWLTRSGRTFSLLAPRAWEGAIRRRSNAALLRGVVETWVRPDERIVAPTTSVRRLTVDDADGFNDAAPAWALKGWGSFNGLIERGAAFGVLDRDGGFAALAWIFEADHDRDALAVATRPRYQRLGLGRAAGSALVAHVEADRRKTPLWTVADVNVASKALARSLGFSPRAREVVLRWGA
jgi:GNAT superfamily N-acetyltransferase